MAIVDSPSYRDFSWVRVSDSLERGPGVRRYNSLSVSSLRSYLRTNAGGNVAVELNWTNKSPEYREALDSYVEHIFKHIKDQDYGLDQVNSLAVAAACESTSMMLDPEAYLRARGVSAVDRAMAPIGYKRDTPDERLVNPATAREFINIQTERFKWILEDAISSDYNIAVELLRKRRLDA